MCIYIYIYHNKCPHICTHTFTYIYIYTYIHTYIHTYTHTYIHVNIYIYIEREICVYVCTCAYIYIYIQIHVFMCIYIYIPRGPSVLILRTGSYFSSVNFKNGFYYSLALAIILEISLDLWVISIYLSTYRSIMHSSACGSTGCVDTTLIYYVDLLDVWMCGHTGKIDRYIDI